MIIDSEWEIVFQIFGFKFRFVRIQQKIDKAMKTLEYFSSNGWEYSCDNVLQLNDQMSETDKKVQ